MTLKVMVIVGTRPELIKLSRVIQLVKEHCDVKLVHTGQNFDYELNEVFFKDLEIPKPDYFLNAAKENSASTIANVISTIDKVLENERPDSVLIYGDTNSCMAVIAAKKRQIPIFHMEAGNRCFDQRVPEEVNRKIVDHLSDVNMVHSEHARRYLINEGIPPELIFKTGSPMVEILEHYKDRILNSDVLTRLNLKAGDYFIVSAHREENVDYELNFKNLLESLNSVAKQYEKRVIVSTHPRTMKRLENFQSIKIDPRVEFLKPLGYFDYNKLQKSAFCVLSDSGTLTEEASLLGFPGVMIRQAHERPEGMDAGVVIMSGLSSKRVLNSIETVTELFKKAGAREIEDYKNELVSHQVVKLILSYTDYINRVIWHKNI